MSLSAGDMCVIIRGPTWTLIDPVDSYLIGRTVTLVRLCVACGHRVEPHWITAGGDAHVTVTVRVSDLRKIFPDQLCTKQDERVGDFA